MKVEEMYKVLERVRQERGGQAPVRDILVKADVPLVRQMRVWGWVDIFSRGNKRIIRITTRGRMAYKLLEKLMGLMQ